MPLLADIFSAGNTFKRRMRDFAANPGAFLEAELAYRNQKAGEFNTLQDVALQGDINRLQGTQPTQEQQAAELKLRDIVTGAYNPIGMTVKNPLGVPKVSNLQEFQELASKGQMRMAKSRKQEIEDLKSGKSKFAELNLNWEDPATYRLMDRFERAGYKFVRDTASYNPNPPTFIFRDFEDVWPVLNATNQAEFGKAY